MSNTVWLFGYKTRWNLRQNLGILPWPLHLTFICLFPCFLALSSKFWHDSITVIYSGWNGFVFRRWPSPLGPIQGLKICEWFLVGLFTKFSFNLDISSMSKLSLSIRKNYLSMQYGTSFCFDLTAQF